MQNNEALAVIYCSHAEASLRQYRDNFSKIRQAEVYIDDRCHWRYSLDDRCHCGDTHLTTGVTGDTHLTTGVTVAILT